MTTVMLQRAVLPCVIALACLALSPPRASAQDWVEFVDETTSRFPAVLRGDPEEKDIAIGDVDRDGDPDLVAIRKEPFSDPGPRTNFMLLNEGGVFVDRTSLIPGFADVTDDRDALLVDVNGDGGLGLGLDDRGHRRGRGLDLEPQEVAAEAAPGVDGLAELVDEGAPLGRLLFLIGW